MLGGTAQATRVVEELRRTAWILGILAFTAFRAAAQIHGLHYWDHWQVGDQVSVIFPNGQAGVAQSDVGLAHREVTRETVCDPVTGDILFSFAGDSIRGADNLVMPHSAIGGFTEYAHWIAHPGDAKIYYLFVNTYGLTSAWHCATVHRDSGILPSEADMPLGPYASNAALDAISSPNGTTTWVVTHDIHSDVFRSYRITSPSGLDTVPVVQHIGPSTGFSPLGAYMRSSPDNSRFALVNVDGNPYWITLFDIDPTAGVLSNPMQLPFAHEVHGAEFSPSSRYLYVIGGQPKNVITQFDLAAGDSAAILQSAVVLPMDTNRFKEIPRLGTDGRIYIGMDIGFTEQVDRYARILDPDQAALACNTDTTGLVFPNYSHGPFIWNYWPFTPSYMSTPEYRAAANRLRAWPVPASNQLNIELGVELDKATVSWMDAAGRLVRTDEWPTHMRTATFYREALRAGSYVVEVRSVQSVPLRAKVILE